MFHYIKGKINNHNGNIFIINDQRGIQVQYLGDQQEGEFWLHPYIDDNRKTIVYFAFDTAQQKNTFEDIIKINGIGPKTGFQIVQLPVQNLQEAIKNLDVRFFQSIPGIGPKSAKKILLALKDTFEIEDIEKMDIDQKLYRNIIQSLKGLGYDTSRVKEVLKKYDGKIDEKNIGEVIKWIISEF